MSDTISKATSLRTHTCDELRMTHVDEKVTICGWVQKARNVGLAGVFVDVRDRYGITQVAVAKADEDPEKKAIYDVAASLGREWCVSVTGTVVERKNKNSNRPTGNIEIVPTSLKVLSESLTPPFKIEDETDGKEDIRARYRYLDIRRNPIKEALMLRHKVTSLVRNYLSDQEFCEIETPVLIKSTPEGARDFVVPSRMNPGQFYALPQSPQTFKQILMVAGMDRYFQIVKCFRDEELRADRQPEFTQIDCEMSFVQQDDVLNLFEDMIRHVFKEIVGHEFPKFQRMPYEQAMREYGIDKPDLRYGMKLVELNNLAKKGNFPYFDDSELVVAISVPTLGKLSNKKVKEIVKIAKSPRIGAKGMVWVKVQDLAAGKIASSVDKNFEKDDIMSWVTECKAQDGDLICIFAGDTHKTRESMGKMRHDMGTKVGLRNEGFEALWVVDFPLLEWDEDAKRYTAMHHPFTTPLPEDVKFMESEPGKVRAAAYDMVVNGVELGGGSIRIHEKELQHKIFELLGFTKEAAEEQFGFLLGAFEYGAPPHGGLAFGLDRLCTILGGKTSIRDYIAFPKNKSGCDMMINSPSPIAPEQMEELCIASTYVPPVEEAGDGKADAEAAK